MYTVNYTSQFKRAVKLCIRRGLDVNKIAELVDIIKTLYAPLSNKQVNETLRRSCIGESAMERCEPTIFVKDTTK